MDLLGLAVSYLREPGMRPLYQEYRVPIFIHNAGVHITYKKETANYLCGFCIRLRQS